MANSKINTEETILRTPTDAVANADANSVRVYTDGTHVFSRDSGGAVINLSTGGGGGASSAAPAGSIQLSDGSGGFNGSTWTIDGNGDLQPTTHVDKQLGIIGKAVQKAYYGSEGINLLRNNALTSSSTPAVTDNDYAKIYTDGAGGTIIYEAVKDSNFHTSVFKGSDNAPAKIVLESGAGTNNVSLHADEYANGNQVIEFPKAKGAGGQVLQVTSVTGDTMKTSWVHKSESIKFNRNNSAELKRHNRTNLFESMSNVVNALIWIDQSGTGLTSSATESDADIVNIFADGFSGTSVSVYEQTLNSVNYGLALFFDQGTSTQFDSSRTIDFKVTAYAQHPFNSSDENRTALGATVLKSSASYNAANTGGSGGGFIEFFLSLTKAETESLFNSIGSTDCSHGIYIECKLYNSSIAVVSPSTNIRVSGFHLLADAT